MLFCIKQYLVLRSKCRETDWVITCYKWPASATLEMGCLGSLEFLELAAFDAVDGHSHLHIFLVFFAGWWLAGQESSEFILNTETKISSRKTD